MTLILSGTSGLSDVDGSAATPAIRGTDANTGMFFPAADTIAFSEGGVESVRIDASGNVGIGTSSPTGKLHVNGGTFDSFTISGNSTNSVGMRFQNSAASSRNWNIGSSGGGPSPAGSFFIYDDTAAATRMSINSSGNVGIGTTAGTTTVSSGLAINNATAANYPGLEIQTAGVTRLYFNANNAESYITSVSTNPLVISTNGSERMRINSSGNVGIGTSSPSGILDARGDVYLGNTSTGTTTFVRGAANWNFAGLTVLRNASNTSTPRIIGMPLDGDDLASTTIGAYNAIWGAYDSSPTTSSTSSALNGAMVYGAYAGHRWFNNGSEKMRITASGDVGIGTISPTSTLTVQGTPNGGTVSFKHGGNNSFGTILTLETIGGTDDPVLSFKNYNGGSPVYYGIACTDDGALGFRSNASTGGFGDERMRITSSGNLLVGTQTDADNAKAIISFTGGSAASRGLVMVSGSTASTAMIAFKNPNGYAQGEILTSGSTTAYNTSSDYRLKENVAPMQNALATVAALKPCTYTWKVDGSSGQGFIAHELQAVVPDCVTGEKDAVDKDGKPQYQGVDTSFLVATVVKALQELKAEVDSLKAQLQGAA